MVYKDFHFCMSNFVLWYLYALILKVLVQISFMFRLSPYSRSNEAPSSTVKFMMFICMISFSMYRPSGSCFFDVWGLRQIFILHLDWKNVCYLHVYWPSGFFLYTVVVFLSTRFVVSAVRRYLYTSVDVISEFFSYHVWLWLFLWWSGILRLGYVTCSRHFIVGYFIVQLGWCALSWFSEN